MSTIMEKLDQEHGTNYWVMLDSLGGHPTEIINKYQALLDNGSYEGGMYAMLSTLNTIGIISGTVSYLPGETLSAQALMIEWNKANPDASPISVNTSIL